MTKSQNTKNEQQKDLCITSEQLTEQWKQGELTSGHYWIRLSWGGMVIMAYHTAFDGLFELDDHYYDSDEISEVLAPVPSYDEWQASENYIDYLKQCISVYESKDKQATETSIAYNELLEENAQLKELLKEYKNQLSEIKNAYIDLTTQDEYGSYYIDEAKLFVEIIGKTIKDFDEHKIDNTIGEK